MGDRIFLPGDALLFLRRLLLLRADPLTKRASADRATAARRGGPPQPSVQLLYEFRWSRRVESGPRLGEAVLRRTFWWPKTGCGSCLKDKKTRRTAFPASFNAKHGRYLPECMRTITHQLTRVQKQSCFDAIRYRWCKCKARQANSRLVHCRTRS